jgi:hypothetical protein
MLKKAGIILFLFLLFATASLAQFKPILQSNGELIDPETSELGFFVVPHPATNSKIIFWTAGATGGEDIKGMRINNDGSVGWGPQTIVSETGDQEAPYACVTSDGNIVVVWRDSRGTFPDIYAKKIDPATGSTAPVWVTGETRITVDDNKHYSPKVCPDTSGGVYAAWRDIGYLYAQHINTHGTVEWTSDLRLELYLTTYDYKLIADGSDNAFACYSKTLPAGNSIRLLKFHSKTQTPTEGEILVVGTIGAGDRFDAAKAGNYIVICEDDQEDISAQIVEFNVSTWADVDICNDAGIQEEPRVVADNSGNAYIAWNDSRGTNPDHRDIYIQKVDTATETTQWASNGIPVTTAEGFQSFYLTSKGGTIEARYPVAYSDGKVFIAWHDFRRDPSFIWNSIYTVTLEADIFMQVLDAGTGDSLLGDDLPVCSAQNGQILPVIAASSPLAAWYDSRDHLVSDPDLKLGYQIVQEIPTSITGVTTSPSSSNIIITGQGFGADPAPIVNPDFTLGSGYNNVSINSSIIDVVSWSPEEITIVPSFDAFAPGTYDFEVTAYGDKSDAFRVVKPSEFSFDVYFNGESYYEDMYVTSDVTVTGEIESYFDIVEATVQVDGGSEEAMSLSSAFSHYLGTLSAGAHTVRIWATDGYFEDSIDCHINISSELTMGPAYFDNNLYGEGDYISKTAVFKVFLESKYAISKVELSVGAVEIDVTGYYSAANGYLELPLDQFINLTGHISFAISAEDANENTNSKTYKVEVWEEAHPGIKDAAATSVTSDSDGRLGFNFAPGEGDAGAAGVSAVSPKVRIFFYGPSASPIRMEEPVTAGYNEIVIPAGMFDSNGVYIIKIYDEENRLLTTTRIVVLK